MRVPPPNLLKIEKDNLLEDVRSKLSEKYPDYAAPEDGDATDPAWVILEQAAWLVEPARHPGAECPFPGRVARQGNPSFQ